MPNTVLLGAQWGDEGKGKIIDFMTEAVDWVVRYQGGNNAGHTVKVGDQVYVLHLIPSGILRSDKKCVIGNGAVVDPIALLKEIDEVHEKGIPTEGRLFICDRTHVVLPYHRLRDEARETSRANKQKLGTTKRGIGPAYGDKAARTGLRMGDLLEPQRDDTIRARLQENNIVLEALGAEPVDVEAVVTQYTAAAERLRPYIADTVTMLNQAIARGESLLFEGAQGTMLDIDYGTYPYVTSSSTTVGGVCTGSGVAPRHIHHVLGVIKAYTTRVGEGPFPTELKDGVGEFLRKEGAEFGATTGRPRRCGWFDAVLARYSATLNGIDTWSITKLDVLDKVETIKICVAYEVDGERTDSMPASCRRLERCVPVYEEFQGWMASTHEATCFEELPERAQLYIRRLEELTGVPARFISVGPGRHSTMELPLSQ